MLDVCWKFAGSCKHRIRYRIAGLGKQIRSTTLYQSGQWRIQGATLLNKRVLEQVKILHNSALFLHKLTTISAEGTQTFPQILPSTFPQSFF